MVRDLLLGAALAIMVTTPEGQNMLGKTGKVATTAATALLKAKTGIDVTEILKEEPDAQITETP